LRYAEDDVESFAYGEIRSLLRDTYKSCKGPGWPECKFLQVKTGDIYTDS